MNCYLYGILACALLGGSIGTMTVSETQHKQMVNALSPKHAKIYQSIVAERRNHYLFGLFIGLVLAFILGKQANIKNDFTRISFFVTVTLGTAVLFYLLTPKSDSMLNYLSSRTELEKWLQMYKTMRTRYMVGCALGFLSAIPLAMILC